MVEMNDNNWLGIILYFRCEKKVGKLFVYVFIVCLVMYYIVIGKIKKNREILIL